MSLVDAAALDAKLDDGKPLSGSVISVSYYYWPGTGCTTTTLRLGPGTGVNGYNTTAAPGAQVDVLMRANF